MKKVKTALVQFDCKHCPEGFHRMIIFYRDGDLIFEQQKQPFSILQYLKHLFKLLLNYSDFVHFEHGFYFALSLTKENLAVLVNVMKHFNYTPKENYNPVGVFVASNNPVYFDKGGVTLSKHYNEYLLGCTFKNNNIFKYAAGAATQILDKTQANYLLAALISIGEEND